MCVYVYIHDMYVCICTPWQHIYVSGYLNVLSEQWANTYGPMIEPFVSIAPVGGVAVDNGRRGPIDTGGTPLQMHVYMHIVPNECSAPFRSKP